MRTMGLSFLLSLALLSLPLGNTAARPAGADWMPVDPATLSATTPTVEKDADAEAIFWDVRVQDDATTGSLRTVLQHYIRIKIFTERCKEKHGQVEIPYLASTRVSDIAGRTIKPDGSIVVNSSAQSLGQAWAATEVSVNGSNVTNVTLALQEGMTIAGRVSFSGTAPRPPWRRRCR